MKEEDEDEEERREKQLNQSHLRRMLQPYRNNINNFKLLYNYKKEWNYFIIHYYYFCYLIR